MTPTILGDTGFVVAVLARNEPTHRKRLDLYKRTAEIGLPYAVLTEVAYMLRIKAGPEAVPAFLTALPTSHFRLITMTQSDLDRTAELLNKYNDTRLDFVDASLIASAERLRIDTLYTLDRRDFSLVRPAHCSTLTLLPSSDPR